jgi:adenosylcobinamide-phosphate synthase
VTTPDPAVIVCALLLDLVIGDPRCLPHPVSLIGRLITKLEEWLRVFLKNEWAAGVLLLIITAGIAMLATWLFLRGMEQLHTVAGFLAAVIVSATCLAARSLHKESALVADALAKSDLGEARRCLSFIVGRDTANLDEGEIWRALVETVAENSCDGIIAPMFWLTIGGPVACMAFKAVSTLDSMVGYRNERYKLLGRASARMDDLMNFIPARLTALLIIVSAPLAGLSLRNALSVTLRDRLKHPSPNSGHSEAAAAGALGVQLGGAACYDGQASWKEYLGDPLKPLDEQVYRSMIRLMYTITIIMAVGCTAAAIYLKG